MGIQSTHDSYAKRAGEYVEHLGSLDAMSQVDVDTISAWATSIEAPSLDAGCGPGHWTSLLLECGSGPHGIDLVPQFIDTARVRFPGIPFSVGNFEKLPFPDQHFGGILSWYSIIHANPHDVPSILREFARCLRPEGELLIGFFEGPEVQSFEHAIAPAWYWPAAARGNLLADAGLTVIRTSSRDAAPARRHGEIVAKRESVGTTPLLPRSRCD